MTLALDLVERSVSRAGRRRRKIPILGENAHSHNKTNKIRISKAIIQSPFTSSVSISPFTLNPMYWHLYPVEEDTLPINRIKEFPCGEGLR
jgi:hypothetical protein